MTANLDLNRLFYLAEDFMRERGRTNEFKEAALFFTTDQQTLCAASFPVMFEDSGNFIADTSRFVFHAEKAQAGVLVLEAYMSRPADPENLSPELQDVIDGKRRLADAPEHLRCEVIAMIGQDQHRSELRVWEIEIKPDKTRAFIPREPVWSGFETKFLPLLFERDTPESERWHAEVNQTARLLFMYDIPVIVHRDIPNIDPPAERAKRQRLKDLVDGW